MSKLKDYITKNFYNIKWNEKLNILNHIMEGLSHLHNQKIIHRDFHSGNILYENEYDIVISDLGISKSSISNEKDNEIYGVIPYVAPEIFQGQKYTKASDIYSFGMIMYFVATGRQPFADRAHDQDLALSICNGIRPEITEKEAPKCYIDLMKKCWDPNPDNRPNAREIGDEIVLFEESGDEIEKQFEEAYEYKKENLSHIGNNQTTTHPQAIYTSRLLNPYTTDLINIDWSENNNDQ